MESIDKSTRWAFTAYEGQWDLFKSMPPIVAEWGWQTETCPDTQRLHYQGYLRTQRQVRFNQIKKALPGVHLETAQNWDALVNYCKKPDTAVPGTQVHVAPLFTNMTMAAALIKVAEQQTEVKYEGCESVEEFKQLHKVEFEIAVGMLLKVDENLIGLYSQPQYERAYVKWRDVWKSKVIGKTDRQTDKNDSAVDSV